jgi:hypothetical protein
MPKESFETFNKKVKRAHKILDMLLNEIAAQEDTFIELYGHPNQLRVTTTVDVDGKENVEQPNQLDNSKKSVNVIQHVPKEPDDLLKDIRKQLSEMDIDEGLRRWVGRKIFSNKRMKHAAIGAAIGTAAGLATGFAGAYKHCKEKSGGDSEQTKQCLKSIAARFKNKVKGVRK